MKARLLTYILTALLVTLSTCGYAYAQSRTNRIFRPCPGTTTKASVSIDVDGSITATPCSGKTLNGPGIPLTSYLAATVTYTSTAALANTALSVTVPAAGNYEIDLMLHSTAGLIGLNVDFAGTAVISNFIGQWTAFDVANPSNFPFGARVSAAGTDFTGGLGATPAYYIFRGTAEFSAGGTFLVRGAQAASDGTPTTILRGSALKLTKLN